MRFSDDDTFLAMAEPADFVHIFDAATLWMNQPRVQVIDFFGEIGGTVTEILLLLLFYLFIIFFGLVWFNDDGGEGRID